MRRGITLLVIVVGLATSLVSESAAGDEAAFVAELIDRHIQSRLDADGLRRAPQADDTEFLRRVYLDLHGVVPSAERAAQFLDTSGHEKRTQLIDELLASPQFGKHFGDVWRRRLISPSANEQETNLERFADWLADRFNKESWDRIVNELLTFTGKMAENPAVIYLIQGRHPLGVTDLTDLSSRYFLGIRLNCAQCHDHPSGKWTRRDYWGMASFFAQIQTPGRPKMVHLVGVQDNPRMTMSSLLDADMIEGFQSHPPTFLGGEELDTSTDTIYRQALARWLTSPENPYFARATVNRIWWHFFGRGIVNPVDDMHAGNAPSHAELLELLSRQFVDSGFDLKFLCRAILNSRTYQQTSRPGEQSDAEAELFARMSIKVLSAEQVFDSLVEILGAPARTPGIDVRSGARYEFCQFFAGDGDLDPIRYERGIPHLLRLMNSPQFAGRNISSLVSRIATPGRPADEVVEELFLAILTRRPTVADQALVRDQLARANASPSTAYCELVWALLMSSEFTLNH